MTSERRSADESRLKLEEAGVWLVRLRSEAVSPADRAAFEAWLKADQRNRDAYALVCDAVDDFRVSCSDLRDYLEMRRPHAPDRRAFAAAIIVAGLAGWGAFAALAPEAYATAIGEHRSIELADASRVEMNTNTAIQVRYGGDARRVRIKRGEAVFDVSRDPQRPFFVEVKGQTIHAVGTQFAVRVDPDALVVLVMEGAVTVSAEPAPPRLRTALHAARLTAGQRLDLAGAALTISAIEPAEISRNLAWRTGWIEFNGETLADATREVARYTRARFVIDDPDVRDLRIVARLRVADLDGFLLFLETGAELLDVERNGEEIHITRREAALE